MAALFTILALTLTSRSALAAGDIDPARLRAADSEPQNWFTLGRDQNQTYYSPLAKIDASNVSRLGFAWAYDLGTTRGQEATPIVAGGTMRPRGTAMTDRKKRSNSSGCRRRQHARHPILAHPIPVNLH